MRERFIRQSVLLEQATDLASLKGKRIIVMLDEQNVSKGAEQLGLRMRYDLLAERVHAAAATAKLHVFLAARPGASDRVSEFERLGFIAHAKVVRYIRPNGRGSIRDANIDNLFSFWLGWLVRTTPVDMVVIGSGDYGLSGELAKEIRMLRSRRPIGVATLSLPGSTAQDLDARHNLNIRVNLEIGLDVLDPMVQFDQRAV